MTGRPPSATIRRVPSPPLKNIESLKLIAELERRGLEVLDSVLHAPTAALMDEVTRRSTASLCMSYQELGRGKGWSLNIRGIETMGPILHEILFADGMNDDEDDD